MIKRLLEHIRKIILGKEFTSKIGEIKKMKQETSKVVTLLESDVNRSVAQMIDYIKTNTENNLVETLRKDDFELSDEDIRKLTYIVKASIEQGFTRGYSQVEKTFKLYK